jgi:hypothetical protein
VGGPLILGQRSIGHPTLRSPQGWAESIQRRYGGRIRQHPGRHDPPCTLEEDVADAGCVFTWASAAALQALALGVPVFYEMPQWIGARAALPLSHYTPGGPYKMDDAERLAMFRRLAWAMWRLDEIDSGEAFRHLLALEKEKQAVAA